MKQLVYYQGIAGAFSHIAAEGYFGKKHTFTGIPTFHTIFSKVEQGNVDYGVIPVENSLAGSVVENYDLLYRHDVSVIGEYYQSVRHNVLIKKSDAKNPVTIQDITKVYSHPKALEQCIRFFEEHPHVQKVVYNDTAEAARYIASSSQRDIAAIASKQAAELYKLTTLVEDIQDNPNNWTRFLIITNLHREQDILAYDTMYKCSLMFTLPHEPGSLYAMIGIFSNAHMNLSKIESRPIHGTTFEYVFTIDVEFHSHDYALIRELIKSCEEVADAVKVLGYYRKAKIAT